MGNVSQLLLVFACVLFFIGIFTGQQSTPPSPWYGRFNFVSAGLFAWSLALVIARHL
jgi:hypothetical protein